MIKILMVLFVLPAHAQNLCDFPDPGYKIEASQRSGIVKSEFDRVLDQVESKFAPIFRAKGYRLKIIRSWSNGTVNAQAWWSGSTCNVEMFGGLARFPGISAGAVRQVALHEVGHCIGGPPFYSGFDMSCEGQADYWSTAFGCRTLGVGCRNSSLNLSKSFARMSGEALPWRPGPGRSPVSRTYCEHPDADCRLKTYDAGIVRGQRPGCWFKN